MNPTPTRALPRPHKASGRRSAFVFRCLTFLTCLSAPVVAQPAASVKAPELQQEKDWVDGRWQQSDVGPFLAGNLKMPSGWIAKALTIRLGTEPVSPSACIAYDTATGIARGGWLGGFLRFSPARFGITDAPRVDGQVVFEVPQGSRWKSGDSAARFVNRGFHLRGNRVVLEYQVDSTLIRETAAHNKFDAVDTFVRTFDVAANEVPLTVPIVGGFTSGLVERNGHLGGSLNGRTVFVGLRSSGSSVLKQDAGTVFLEIPPSRAARQIELEIALRPAGDEGLAVTDQSNRPKLKGPYELLQDSDAPRWSGEITTVGQRAADLEPFSVDTITVPYSNPWKALFFVSGVDFTANGDAYVCTIHGDVWRVRGIDGALSSLHWKRFATGLAQPLGLKVVKDQVHVLGKDQITRLVDSNADGEAERYETVSNLIETSTGGHDFVTNLETDKEGRFYYVDPVGAHRISRTGDSTELLGTGWRNPNGLGLSPEGILTVTPQQGTWTPSSVIFEAHAGGYYGFGGPKVSPSRPLGYDVPLCWIPHSVDNSSSSQTWVPKGTWGELGGRMLHLLWGRSAMMLGFRDDQEGLLQGGVVPLPSRFLSGPMRARFFNGDLYVAGSTGWQTTALRDGSFQRVRRSSKALRIPLEARVHQNGLMVRFSEPLEKSAAEDPGSYAAKQWNYRYTSAYGSRDYSLSDPNKEGRDEVAIVSARLQPDGRSVWIETQPLVPVMQFELKYNLNGPGGEPVKGQFWLTINQPRSPFTAAKP